MSVKDVKNIKYKDGFKSIDGEFVRACDAEFDFALERAVNRICDDGEIKIVGLTGPTCSGKTTAAKKLISAFKKMGKTVHAISLDDFYRDVFRRDRIDFGKAKELDFDSPSTIDIEEFSRFISEIKENGVSKRPCFDFLTGTRSGYEEVRVGENDVFIYEGIQVLYPEVSRLISGEGGVTLYIYPESAINFDGKVFYPDEIRLMRRIVRDFYKRSSTPEFTMALWGNVRRNEEENIFPFVDACSLRVDTTLAYELNMLAPYLRDIIGSMDRKSEFYPECLMMLEKIDGIEGISPRELSKNSLYHEFVIG